MKKVCIIGAGVMGISLAQVLLENNYLVLIIDIDKLKLEKAKKSIIKEIGIREFLNKSKPKYSKDELLKMITTSLTNEESVQCDIIIDCSTENVEVKKNIFRQIDKYTSSKNLILCNTSCIPISELGSFTTKPNRVIGTHFMNPVTSIDTVEVIKGYYTSDDTIDKTKQFITSLGKKAILINDAPGFVSNRISHLLMNEATLILQEGTATIEQIDDIFKNCFGHKMGPLETADLIGLDTVVNSLDILYKNYGDMKFKCSTILRKMVIAGLLGRKSGEGFYKYI